jgi:hypothetical protein
VVKVALRVRLTTSRFLWTDYLKKMAATMSHTLMGLEGTLQSYFYLSLFKPSRISCAGYNLGSIVRIFFHPFMNLQVIFIYI